MRYKSKVDLWLVILLLVVGVFAVVTVWNGDEPQWGHAALVVLVFAACFMLIDSIHYVVEDATLTVKCCGLSMGRYAIADITEISHTHTLLAAPAASLDRLAISLRGKAVPVVISPKKQADFIVHLLSINSEIAYKER